MNKIIVTGASGMIGSDLIDIAIRKNIEVLALVRKNTKKIKNIPKNDLVKVIECDIDEIKSLPQMIKNTKYDIFYHFAWCATSPFSRDDINEQLNNIVYSLDAIKVAAKLGCKKFVFAGSQAEYGLHNEPLRCDTNESPLNGYGIAKNTVTKFGRILANQLGIDFCSGRILSAYGIKDNSYTMISTLINKINIGEDMKISPCTQIWDYINSKDVANAFYLIGEKGVNGKAYPIASGEGRPLKYYVETIYRLLDGKGRNVKLNYGSIPPKKNAVTYLVGDISELTKDTGFVPRISFEEGIKEIIKGMGNE